MSHTTPPNTENPSCDCKAEHSLPFLDTSCKILDGKIVTDLFRKETDRNQYLLPSSCHPTHVTDNIPYSLALRIVRICTFSEDREKRFLELKNLLLSRDYKPRLIDSAIERARNVPRSEALKRVSKEITTNRPVFVIHFYHSMKGREEDDEHKSKTSQNRTHSQTNHVANPTVSDQQGQGAATLYGNSSTSVTGKGFQKNDVIPMNDLIVIPYLMYLVLFRLTSDGFDTIMYKSLFYGNE